MTKPFSYFAICAEMRTGSNFLEASLNEFPDLQCYGEAYNPHFVGHHNKEEMFGVDLETREHDPLGLIERMKSETDGIPGFRFFNDHDPRVRDHILMDPACAKIILTRNPLDSYVSLKIAAQTGQWKLSDMKQRRSAMVSFDEAEFQEHLEAKQAFQLDILRHLQISGQTAYYIAYEDVGELEIVNGLAKFIGSAERIENLPKSVKKQNPGTLEEKVVNFDEMIGSLAKVDHFAMSRTPNFEPRRGPGVPGFVHAAKSPLLYIPIGGGPNYQVLTWMAELDEVDDDDLGRRLSQKDLRQWKRNNSGHRSFSVLSHPLERAHRVFCEHLLPISDNGYSDPRRIMRNRYGVSFPNQAGLKEYSLEMHKAAFGGFLKFLKGNLAGQTSVRIDVTWATQSAILEGAGQVIFPDVLIRMEDFKDELDSLAKRVGRPSPDLVQPPVEPFGLGDIYDDEVEKWAQQAYRRDYINFGFKPWG